MRNYLGTIYIVVVFKIKRLSILSSLITSISQSKKLGLNSSMLRLALCFVYKKYTNKSHQCQMSLKRQEEDLVPEIVIEGTETYLFFFVSSVFCSNLLNTIRMY